MNKETFDRLKEAKNYQRKAIYALFPEECKGHLRVIEHELNAMLKELVVDVVEQEFKRNCDSEQENKAMGTKKTEGDSRKNTSKVKKVLIC